jgi:uncharacterized protein (DUF58 family)
VGRSLHPRVAGYVAVVGAALIAAVALQQPALAALGAPVLAMLLVGLLGDAAAADAEVDVRILVADAVVRSGDTATVTISLTSPRRIPRCGVALELPPALVCDRVPSFLVRLEPGEAVELELHVLASAPGELSVGPAIAECSGSTGLLRHRLQADAVPLAVRPREERVRSLPRTSRVRVPAGDRLARSRGDGIELAEVRPELPGEHFRRLNRRATARYGIPHVTLRHPEQSTDVVIFTDTFESPELPRVLEAASAAAAGYLAHRDRVGLVAFGGVLDWVEAGSGPRQLERIRSRLAGTSPFFSYAWKTIDRIPSRAMPAGALVLAISPLRDERFMSALAAVHARGHEVVVVEVTEAPPVVRPGERPAREVALRLARMEREDLRNRLFLRGIPVATLLPSDPLEMVLSSLTQVMRRRRPVIRR